MSNNKSAKPDVEVGDTEITTQSSLIVMCHGQAIAIRKNPDYTATVATIHKAFPGLEPYCYSCIHLSAQLEEYGDLRIEIYGEVWAELLQRISVVEVSAGGPLEAEHCTEELASNTHSDTQVEPEQIIVYIDDPHSNTEYLHLSLLETSTIRQLKDLILQHDNRLPQYMVLSYEEHSNLEDERQLYEYGIENKSTVTLLTEFKVYLSGPLVPRHPVTIVTFATVRVLKLLIFAHTEDNWRTVYPGEQVMTCGGEVLDNARKLGSYSQLVPGCEICVNKATTQFAEAPNTAITLRVHTEPEDGEADDYKVLPESSILELKVLISNRTKTSVWQQRLFSLLWEPLYDLHVIGERFTSEDVLRLTVW